jgi:hypothetical protein
VASLIRGIFDTDGGVATSNNDSMPFLKLGMTAEAVVVGVQSLLAQRFGIYGQVGEIDTVGTPVKIVPGSFSNHNVFCLVIADRKSVTRFAEVIGFTTGHKKEKLLRLLAASHTSEREDDFLFHFVSSTYVGEDETFDIEVNHPDHLFVLENGAIVSNSKQLNQLAHRLVVVGDDAEDDDDDPEDEEVIERRKLLRGVPRGFR